ncbi:MAG TPA: M36 family metallopeptidase, partial [Verrucomicrobiae bacterium]
MKTKFTGRGHQICILFVYIQIASVLISAQGVASQPLPDFDHRQDQTPAVANATTSPLAKIAVNLQGRVPQLNIDRDAILGGPKFIGSTAQFLTGANGAGGAVTETTANQFPLDEPKRGVKTFLTEHRALFGFGPEALTTAKINRDYISANSGSSSTVWQQQIDEIDVFEAVFKAHLTKRGELINVSSQFVPDLPAATGKITNRTNLEANPPVSAAQAIMMAAQNLGESLAANQLSPQDSPQGNNQVQHFNGFPTLNPSSARLTWLPLNANDLRLCWQVEIADRTRGEVYLVLVDAQSGEIWRRTCLTEYLANASFNVWTGESPAPMSPGLTAPGSTQASVVARTLVTWSALDTNASPAGWINDGGNTTIGNNVDAHLDWDNDDVPDPGSRPVGSPFRVFDFPVNLASYPMASSNAMVVSLFYWNNWAHDRFYEYGFTEAAGNFQANNFGRGGVGGDAVMADGQDSYTSTNFNNANFYTPADGTAPKMQMYIFVGPVPNRDGDLDAGVMLHEYTHGVSSRLVGGGTLISALQTKGMGEGWSDFCALSLLANATNDPDANYTTGAYLTYQFGAGTNHNNGLTANYYYGIRHYPYSVNTNVSPLTYKDIDTNQISSHPGIPINPAFGFTNVDANEVHHAGEVWCVTLWEARSR